MEVNSGRGNSMRVVFGWKPEWRSRCERGAHQAGISPAMQPLTEVELSDFDAVVPLKLEDHAIIERARAGGRMIHAVIVPARGRENCHDKVEFSKRMTASGFGAYLPRMLEPAEIRGADFPVVVKSRREANGRGTHVIHNQAELEPHLPSLGSGEALVQELIPGDEEFAAHLLMHEGMLMYATAIYYKMPRSHLIKGHEWKPVVRHWLPSCPFKPLWYEILQSLGITSGTVCIDYRLRDGRPVIFEINPRLGASLTIQMADYLEVYMSCVGRSPRVAIG